MSLTNQGVANAQYSAQTNQFAGDYGQGNAGPLLLTMDTTASQLIGTALELGSGNGSDFIILDRVSIRLYPTSP
jgi:hypothetical protein